LLSLFFSANTKRLKRRRNSRQAISSDTVPFQFIIFFHNVIASPALNRGKLREAIFYFFRLLRRPALAGLLAMTRS